MRQRSGVSGIASENARAEWSAMGSCKLLQTWATVALVEADMILFLFGSGISRSLEFMGNFLLSGAEGDELWLLQKRRTVRIYTLV